MKDAHFFIIFEIIIENRLLQLMRSHLKEEIHTQNSRKSNLQIEKL
jgi:hypothetical protein